MATPLIHFGSTEEYSPIFSVVEDEEITLHLVGDGDAEAHIMCVVHLQIESSTGSFQTVDKLTGAKAGQVLSAVGRFRLYRPETTQPGLGCGVDRD